MGHTETHPYKIDRKVVDDSHSASVCLLRDTVYLIEHCL
eukprot:XP_001707453.1 Hypothetical protein GL50803_4445 [Giardia lamblia ATCC 50803]